MPHRAGPGAAHLIRLDVAALDDAQCVEQLRPEERAASRVISQCGERRNHRKTAEVVAEIAFQSPEGDQEPGLYPVFLVGAPQQVLVLLEQLAAALDALLVDAQVDIAPEGLGELGLPTVEFDDSRDGRCILQRQVERFGGDSLGQRFAAQGVEPGLEAGV